MKKRRLAILGSTGSIGTQALKVAALHPDRFEVAALTAHSSREKLFEQVRFGRGWPGWYVPFPKRRFPRTCDSANGSLVRRRLRWLPSPMWTTCWSAWWAW